MKAEKEPYHVTTLERLNSNFDTTVAFVTTILFSMYHLNVSQILNYGCIIANFRDLT